MVHGEYLALFPGSLRTEADIRTVQLDLLSRMIGSQARTLRERLAPATLASK